MSVPTHVTGWLSHSLATSSLLRAVGIDAGEGERGALLLRHQRLGTPSLPPSPCLPPDRPLPLITLVHHSACLPAPSPPPPQKTGAAGTVAASAAIKWIIKDGIGAAGRFLVGGRLGREFDDDPRRWRMVAEGVTTLGLALEISTALYPAHFLALASAGNFAKALAKGLGKPVFRVVQTHFAAAGNNVGAVAAKEEVWEVAAQLAGYAASVALLQALDGADAPAGAVVGVWAAVQGAHVALRYAALSQLRFATLNHKRACALAAAHVAAVAGPARGGSVAAAPAADALGSRDAAATTAVVPLPGVDAVNAAEPMLTPATSVRPRLRLGCTLREALGDDDTGAGAGAQTRQEQQRRQRWAALFADEPFLLARDGGGVAWVVVKRGAAPRELLRAVWQAAWLDAHSAAADSGEPQQQQQHQEEGEEDRQLALLAESLVALRAHFGGFEASLAAAGWDLASPPVLQVSPTRVTVE